MTGPGPLSGLEPMSAPGAKWSAVIAAGLPGVELPTEGGGDAEAGL